MPRKNAIPDLQSPVADWDMRIIANHRYRFVIAAMLGPDFDKGFAIPPFRCCRRGYVLNEGIILMFNPEIFDVRRSILTVRSREPPFEVWILDDDKVTEYFELGGEGAA